MKSSWSQGKDCGWKEKWNIRKASSTGAVIGPMEKMRVTSHATVSLTWVPHFTHISTSFVTQCKYGSCGSFWEACLLSVSWAYYFILTAHFCSWTSQRGSLEETSIHSTQSLFGEVEPRVPCIQGKYSTTKLYPQPCSVSFIPLLPPLPSIFCLLRVFLVLQSVWRSPSMAAKIG